jgi:hypothetical protein
MPNNRISYLLVSFLIAAGMFYSSGTAAAGELGHYMPGVASIRDFYVPPAPGFYYAQYNLYYTTDTFNDRDGNSVDSINIGGPIVINLDTEIDLIAIQPTFIWSTDWHILGARYAAYFGVPVASASIHAALSTTTNRGFQIDDSGDIPLLWYLCANGQI